MAVYVVIAITASAPGSGLVPAAASDGPGWLAGPLGMLGFKLASGAQAALALYLMLWVATLLYAVIVLSRRGPSKRVLLASLALSITVFTLAAPLLSQDVMSYISYARMWALHGFNPYIDAPSLFTGDAAYAYVGWKSAVSAYGPLFTAISYPLGLMGVATALWTLKVVTAFFLAITLAIIWSTAKRIGLDPQRSVALVGLNPIVLVHGVAAAHNDVLVALFITAAVAYVAASKPARAGAAAIAAGSLKLAGALVAPFVLIATKSGRVLLSIVVSLAAVVLMSLALFGPDVANSIGLVGENQAKTSFYSLPSQTARALAGVTGASLDGLLPAVRVAFLVAFALCLLLLLYKAWRDGEKWVRYCGWAVVAMLVATSWLLPWYLIWLLPLAALAGSRPLVYASLILTAYMLMIRVPL